jgi:excisionase family DNA binding protein
MPQITRRHFTCWEQAAPILDIHTASILLGVPEQSLRKLARDKVVPAFKVGKLWKFSKDKLKEFAGVEDTYSASI